MKAWQVIASIAGAIVLVIIVFRIAGLVLAVIVGAIWLALALVRLRRARST